MNNAGLTTYPEIYMPCPFAGEADAGGTSGTNRSKDFSDAKSAANVNMRTGFPTVFTRAQSSNGKYLSRPDMNQLGYMATVGQYRKQIGCLNEFNAAFASKIQGYAKGAVLDYVVYHDQTNHLVSEVWKIVSLVDKNSTAPTSSNILSFGTDSSTAGAGDKLWMRIVPDKAYIEAIRDGLASGKGSTFGVHDGTAKKKGGTEDTNVATEAITGHVHTNLATNVDLAKKIATSDANARFSNGSGQTAGCTDGTPKSATSTVYSNQVRINHTKATAEADGIPVSSEGGVDYLPASWTETYTDEKGTTHTENRGLGYKVPVAVSGHVHTNMYTKYEVDKLIEASGGLYANGSAQTDGYTDGTYSVSYTAGKYTYYGHKHTDYCANSESSSHGDNSHDGTYSESTRGTITTKYGHVHTDYAKKTDVYDTTASDSGFARGGTHGVTDCTAKDASDNILKPNYNTQTITYSDGTTAPKAVYGTIEKGHVHTNYATTEYVADNYSPIGHTHPSSGAGFEVEYKNGQWAFVSESLIIQGGTVAITGTDEKTTHEITFLHEMSGTNYSVVVTPGSENDIGTYKYTDGRDVIVERNTNSFVYVNDTWSSTTASGIKRIHYIIIGL